MEKEKQIELEKDLWINFDELLSKVKVEKSMWEEYMKNKKAEYRDLLLSYDNRDKDKTKIRVNTIFQVIDTLIWFSYTDWVSAQFVSSTWRVWEEEADNRQMTAQYDANQAEYSQMNYQKQRDRFFYGVWIRIKVGWDDVLKQPIFESASPMNWYPDPLPTQKWIYSWNAYRFHWFDILTNYYELKNNWNYDDEDLVTMSNKLSKEEQQKILAEIHSWNYNYSGLDPRIENFATTIYRHYTRLKDQLLLVETDSNVTKILRCEKIKAILSSEKKNPMLNRMPVVLNYYSPKRNDPCWISVTDLLNDKQRAKSILMNLNLIKAKKEALGDDVLYEAEFLKNSKDFMKPSVDRKFIWVDTKWRWLENAMFAVPKPQIHADTQYMIWEIDKAVIADTNIDEVTSWVVPQNWQTATAIDYSQWNMTVKKLLKNKIDGRWEKEFRFLRWRSYKEYFSKTDEKLVVLRDGFSYTSTVMTKKSYNMWTDPYIEIKTKSEFAQITSEQKAYLQAMLPMYIQMQDMPQVSKLFLQRKLARLNWVTNSEIDILYKKTPDEIQAIQYVNDINNWIYPKWLFDDRDKDYFTYWIYTQKAQTWKLKETVLDALKNYLMWKIDVQAQTQQFNSIANSWANIMMSQGISKGMNQETNPALSNQNQVNGQ